MIKHVVCYQLINDSPELRQQVKDTLLTMWGKVEQLRSIEVGFNCVDTSRSYDVVLICTYDNVHAMEEYQAHPDHKQVQRFIQSVVDISVSVDFEVDG